MTRDRLNGLCGDPQLLARLPDAAFDDEIRAEPLPYLANIDCNPFKLKRRCPRDHVEPCYLCE